MNNKISYYLDVQGTTREGHEAEMEYSISSHAIAISIRTNADAKHIAGDFESINTFRIRAVITTHETCILQNWHD
jgi:hypothetical protein